MRYSDFEKREFYDATAGRCHLCKKKLAIRNYGKLGGKGAWEIDHSVPKAKGGSDVKRNKLPACTKCNRSKGTKNTHAIRVANGFTAKPLSRTEIVEKRKQNVWTGSVLVGLAAAYKFGLTGLILGVVSGALVGHSIDPG